MAPGRRREYARKPPCTAAEGALRTTAECRGPQSPPTSRRIGKPLLPYRKKLFIRSKIFWFLTDSACWKPGCCASCSTSRFSSALSFEGDRDVDHDQFVAAAIAVDVGQPLAAQAQHLAGMRSRGDLDLGTAIDRRHLDRTAQQGCRNGDIEVVDQVVAVTHQLGIGLLFDHDLQVAVDASVTGGIALARDGEYHTLTHAGRDSDLHDLLAAEGSLALALVAGVR